MDLELLALLGRVAGFFAIGWIVGYVIGQIIFK